MKQTLPFITALMLIMGFSIINAQQNQIPAVTVASVLYNSAAVTEEVSRDLKHESYPELGLLFSLPIISPAFGYWFGPYGVRVSGMYLEEDLNEFHLNLGYKRLDNERKQRRRDLMKEPIMITLLLELHIVGILYLEFEDFSQS
jgi:hypothetical protein